jgi:hypothetical protein
VIGSYTANSHHVVWGSSDINPRGRALLEYIRSTDLKILNQGKVPIFLTERRQEIIDLSLYSR